MAEEGAPRDAPPPRPASRAPSESGSLPHDDAEDTDDETSRVNRRRASTLNSHREKSADEDEERDEASRDGFDRRDWSTDATDANDVESLHRKLREFRVENDALGEATTALRRALRRATMETAESRAALGIAEAALRDERDAGNAARDEADAEMKRARRELDDVEKLALELKDELEEARVSAAEAKRARRDAENAAAAAAEETASARAMADALRDELAEASRVAEAKAASAKASRERAAHAAAKANEKALECVRKTASEEAASVAAAELLEARAAAERAKSDRDVMASSWRKQWEDAKEDHACELRATRARIANAEADLASARAALLEERAARAAAETALEDAGARERRARLDRDGAIASLRALAEHEDSVREDAARRAAVVGRLRDDATESAARCETLAARCAEACAERDAATLRAERAEADLREMAELAETVAVAQTDRARRGAERSASAHSGSPSPSGSPDPHTAAGLLRRASREGRRSPNAFAAAMAMPPRRQTAAPDPSTPATPRTPDFHAESSAGSGKRSTVSAREDGTPRWIHAVGDAVAEELVHALAREAAELRDALAAARAETAEARSARDDARAALLEETTRVCSLERARVVDLRETRFAERNAHEATKTTWELRDRLALAAVASVEGLGPGPGRRAGSPEPSTRRRRCARGEGGDLGSESDDADDGPPRVESKREYFRSVGARVGGFGGKRDDELHRDRVSRPFTPERVEEYAPPPILRTASRTTSFSPAAAT